LITIRFDETWERKEELLWVVEVVEQCLDGLSFSSVLLQPESLPFDRVQLCLRAEAIGSFVPAVTLNLHDTKHLLLSVTLFLLRLRYLLDERWVVPRADASLLPGVFMSSAHFSTARQAAHSPPVAVAPGARLQVLAVERLLGIANRTERWSNTAIMNTLACGTSLSKLGMVSRARSVLVF
jgi:hypothetical protein